MAWRGKQDRLTTSAPQSRHAPKGDLSRARAALFRFAPKEAPGKPPSIGVPLSTPLVDALIEQTAREYNRRLDVGLRPALIAATANVISAATGFANALEHLAELVPGYMSHEIARRRPERGWNETFVFGVQVSDEATPIGDADVAFAPEIALSYEKRPAEVLRPSIERARALARLASTHIQELTRGVDASAPGRHNAERDGRSAPDTLIEACYLLVAGCFGAEGTRRLTATPHRQKQKRKPLFASLVEEMHLYAQGDAERETFDNPFEGQIRKIVPRMREELRSVGAWHNWVHLASEPTANPIVAMMSMLFAVRLLNPGVRPISVQNIVNHSN